MTRDHRGRLIEDLVGLIQYVLWLLIRARLGPDGTLAIDVAMGLGSDWDEPEAFGTDPVLHSQSYVALAEARSGNQRSAFEALSTCATATGDIRSRWLVNTIRTAVYLDASIAQAALDAAREVLLAS